MEKYFKRVCKSRPSSIEQNHEERNVIDVGDEGNIDEMNVIDVGDEGDESDENDVEIENESDENEIEDIDEIGVVDEGNDGEESDEFNVEQLPSDPGLRIPISHYNVNVRDVVRREYVQRGPCQPRNHEFMVSKKRNKDRRFGTNWYDECPTWLEYSIAKNAVFCLYCYLFSSSRVSFVVGGFSNWKKKSSLKKHVGNASSAHNLARLKFESFNHQEQSIGACFCKQSEQTRTAYRARLGASVDCIRYLLRQGLAFRGSDESEDSSNQGNFLELLKWLCNHDPQVKAVCLENAPANFKLTSPDIQKDIVSAFAFEMNKVIISEIGDGLFSILIDESRDISTKEQMSVVLRYVKNGHVMERFIGIQHVSSTTAISLKLAIDDLFSRYGLSMSNLRGQGYDGASNMRGEYNGLKSLILKENPSAYYIHCFAHQLQLALVAVAKKHGDIQSFFYLADSVVNVVGGSAKRCDRIREMQRLKICEALNAGEISSGRGLNQETSITRSGDTRWGSHYKCLCNLMLMFSSTIDVIEVIASDNTFCGKKGEARVLLAAICTFEFVFGLHLMKKILGISNELSKTLQKKDLDIGNAMCLVKICKQQLQKFRDDDWDSFLVMVNSFCRNHGIMVPNMDDKYTPLGRSRCITVTNLHHFRVDLFYSVIDMQLQELNNRFSEVNSELLLCVACLCPDNSFAAFDKSKLIHMCKFYPKDFQGSDMMELDDQIDTYIIDMRTSEEFKGLQGLGELAQKLVVTKKHEVYSLLYKLLTLALILPVATATVERVFSVMNYVKNRLRNRMNDKWLNDSLLVYIEKDVFDMIDDDVVIQRYQSMRTRKERL